MVKQEGTEPLHCNKGGQRAHALTCEMHFLFCSLLAASLSSNCLVSGSGVDKFNQCWIAPLDNGQPNTAPSYDPVCCASLRAEDIDMLSDIYRAKGRQFFPGMSCLVEYNQTVAASWLSGMFVHNPTLALALLKNIPSATYTPTYSFYKEWKDTLSKYDNLTIHVDQLDLRMVKQANHLDAYLCDKDGPYDDAHCVLSQREVNVIGGNTPSTVCSTLSDSYLPINGIQGTVAVACNGTKQRTEQSVINGYIKMPYFPADQVGLYERLLMSVRPQCFSQLPYSVQQGLGGLYVSLHLDRAGQATSPPLNAVNGTAVSNTFDIFGALANIFHFNWTDWRFHHQNNSAVNVSTVGPDNVLTVKVTSTITQHRTSSSAAATPVASSGAVPAMSAAPATLSSTSWHCPFQAVAVTTQSGAVPSMIAAKGPPSEGSSNATSAVLGPSNQIHPREVATNSTASGYPTAALGTPSYRVESTDIATSPQCSVTLVVDPARNITITSVGPITSSGSSATSSSENVTRGDVAANKSEEYRTYRYNSPEELEAILNQRLCSSSKKTAGILSLISILTLPALCLIVF